MNAKQAKRERREARLAENPDTTTRAGRQELHRRHQVVLAEQAAAAKQAEIDRWNALPPEEQNAEMEAKYQKQMEAEQRFWNLLGMIGAPPLSSMAHAIPASRSSRSPYQRRRR